MVEWTYNDVLVLSVLMFFTGFMTGRLRGLVKNGRR
jgi:hypothetical protein